MQCSNFSQVQTKEVYLYLVLSSIDRTDTNYGAIYSLAADLNEKLSLTGMLSYSKTKSTVEEYEFSDYAVGLQLFYVTQF